MRSKFPMVSVLAAVAIVAIVLLGACGFTQAGDAFEASARGAAAKAYDAGLVNAEQFVCNDASVGSIKRRYGKAPAVYNSFCAQADVLYANPEAN